MNTTDYSIDRASEKESKSPYAIFNNFVLNLKSL